MLLLLAGVGVASLVMAQSGAETWTEPTNLSLSGTATAPQIVDLGDEMIVFWEDVVDHFAFVRGQEGTWSAPATAEFPFATRTYYPDLNANAPTPVFSPQLLYDGSGFVHAFWWDEEAAFHSRVPVDAFGSFQAWTTRQSLADAAVQTTVTVGANGRLHLIYVQRRETAEMSVGVYYRGSADGGVTWSPPQLLYASRYFRLLNEEDANLQIAANGASVYVALDDPAGARALLLRSEDEGVSWQEPFVVDRREAEDAVDDLAPFAVRLVGHGNDVLLTWRAGHRGESCTHYFLHSEDGGRSWQATEPLLPSVLNCSQDVRLLNGSQNVFLAATTYDEQVVRETLLSVWLDDGWSEPEVQAPLSGFTDPGTFRPVSYECGRDIVVREGRLVVAGCGRSVGQDVWLTSRSLSPLVEQVRLTPVWAAPATAPPPAAGRGDATIADPVLVADTAGRFHAFWSQIPDGEALSKEIYYARWADDEWSRPLAVVRTTDGKAVQPAATTMADGRLLLVWSGGATGELFFTWAPGDEATRPNEWRDPQQLPSPQPATSAPHILVDQTGVIYVFYAVPLNEDRGIYLATSADRGASWSEPSLVFDGVAADWEMVDAPRAAVAGGSLHLIWERRSLPVNVSETSLHYARSGDGGRTWTAPQALEGLQTQEARAVWGQIVAEDGRAAHRAWQEWDGNQLLLWHQFSLDGGLNWSRPSRVGDFEDSLEPAYLLQDAATRAYLLQQSSLVAERATSSVAQPELQLWRWRPETEEWATLESVAVASPSGAALAAAVSGGGRLAVVLAGQSDSGEPTLMVTGRELPAPEVLPTPLPTLTPTPAATVGPTATALPQPTATPVFPTTNEGGGLLSGLSILGADSRLVGGLLAFVVTAVVVFLVLIVVTRLRSGRQR